MKNTTKIGKEDKISLEKLTTLLQKIKQNQKNEIEQTHDILDLIGMKFGFNSIEYQTALSDSIEYLPLHMVKQNQIINYLKSEPYYSHVASQISYMRFKQQFLKIDLNLSPWNNDKSIDQDFAKQLGVPVPKILQKRVKVNSLNIISNTVVKPYIGSNSNYVFYVFSPTRIVEIKKNIEYSSIEQWIESIEKRGLEETEWTVEELILNNDNLPAHDVKVYTYYGKIGAVLEVKPTDKTYRCWYDEFGNILESENQNQPWFEGTGFDIDVLDKAKMISLNMPLPFMRVDFYK